jgi:von Willebrand factor type A domain
VDVQLLTPLAALFALTAAVPLTVYVVRRKRLRAIRTALGLDEPTVRSQLPFVLCLAAVPALLGLAAAQPVIETTTTVPERTDAQGFVVIDVSRSMLASSGSGEPTRFDRARNLALSLRDALPELPLGIATVTDRTLPNLFPTTDRQVFEATLRRAVGIERPPPEAVYNTLASNLNSLRAVPEGNYFPSTATKRVIVVLTDGETQPIESTLGQAFERRPKVETILVHMWGADERVYETGGLAESYRPDPRSHDVMARVAAVTGGAVLGEDVAGVVDAVHDAVGVGETVARGQQSGRFALMPWIALAAVIPLAFVLLRRNFWVAEMRPGLPRLPVPSRRDMSVRPRPQVEPAAPPQR